MAKRKTKIEREAEVNVSLDIEVQKIVEVQVSKTLAVRKLIDNPLRLNKHIVLSDSKVFPIPGQLLKDEMFMMHIEYLIELEKLERV